LKCPYAETVLGQIRVKRRSLNSYVGDCDEDIKDLIVRMLEFDPSRRITAEEALELPCLQEFRGKTRENACHKFITTEIDDNSRLSLEEYRRKIYCDIERKYPAANSSPAMPRITRSYHSVESKSLHQYRRLASNSLVKLEKHSTFHQDNSDGFKEQPVKRTAKYQKSGFQKENQDISVCDSLQRSKQEAHPKDSSKMFKRRVRGNPWTKNQ
jgi:serine/threonine protein kinase